MQFIRSFLLFFVAITTLSPNAFAYDTDPDQMAHVYIVGLGKSKDYAALRTKALALAGVLGMKYSDDDRIYDAQKGLIYPSDYKGDEMYAGAYFPRRNIDDPEVQVSLEMRDYYDNSIPVGTMTIMVGVYTSKKEAKAVYKKVKAIDPEAYLLKTDLYMGCMH
ncbi:MAG: hypothetical protein EBR02_02530 [Alphaproteobacteria bacterium]|nr:hypothetical protein [Alphaproteobacteria bacterium]